VVPASDLAATINEARMGRVEFKLDRTGIIHVILGKASFEEEKLLGNMSSLVEAVVKAKPAAAKGQYIRSAFLTTTMGPGIKLDTRTVMSLASG
jgi:large subunit ribosomal protein L1